MHLFSNRSQMMTKYDKNKKVAHEVKAECVPDVPDVFCDLLLNRRMVTWNLLVSYNQETNHTKFCMF